jgi:hypothetical protein
MADHEKHRSNETGTEAWRLAQAVTDWSDRPLEPYRAIRANLLRVFAGSLFGEANPGQIEDAINVIYSAVNVFVPGLTMSPRAEVKPKTQIALRPFANKTAKMLDWLLEENDAENVLELFITDALFARAISYTGLGASKAKAGGLIEPMGWLDDPGMPKWMRVPENNFIEDMSATANDAVDFRGHRFLVALDYAMDSGMYDRDEVERIWGETQQAAAKRAPSAYSESGQSIAPGYPAGYVGNSSGATYANQDKFVESVELMTLWLPKQNRLVTLPADVRMVPRDGNFLRDDKYMGYETGPYDKLVFQQMPDSLLGIAPIAQVKILHDSINIVFDKILAQSKAQADIPVVQPGSEEMGKAFMNVGDQQVITGDPTSIATLRRGGVDEKQWRVLNQCQMIYNNQIGNPNILGGTGDTNPTLGQDEMQRQGAGLPMGYKRRKIRKFVGNGLKKMAYMVWDDTSRFGLERDFTQRVDGKDYTVSWTPKSREGDWGDYHFAIGAYSADASDPDEQAKRQALWLDKYVIPFADQLQANGKRIDAELVIEEGGRLLSVDYADQVVKDAPVSAEPAPGVVTPGSAPRETTSRSAFRGPESVPTAAQGENNAK